MRTQQSPVGSAPPQIERDIVRHGPGVTELMPRVAWAYLLTPEGGLDVADDTAVRDYPRRYLAP